MHSHALANNLSSKLKVGGSNPPGVANDFKELSSKDKFLQTGPQAYPEGGHDAEVAARAVSLQNRHETPDAISLTLAMEALGDGTLLASGNVFPRCDLGE